MFESFEIRVCSPLRDSFEPVFWFVWVLAYVSVCANVCRGARVEILRTTEGVGSAL